MALASLVALVTSAPGADTGGGVTSPASASWGATQLMQTLASVKSSQARFVERKYMAILTAPLESSGTLVYEAPSRLEKRTLKPRAEGMLLDHDRLVIDGSDGSHKVLGLQEYPVVWAFIESMRSTLAGDLATLERFYRVRVEGRAERWTLVLAPREERMRSSITEIRVLGATSKIASIEIYESGGDHSVMSITESRP